MDSYPYSNTPVLSTPQLYVNTVNSRTPGEEGIPEWASQPLYGARQDVCSRLSQTTGLSERLVTVVINILGNIQTLVPGGVPRVLRELNFLPEASRLSIQRTFRGDISLLLPEGVLNIQHLLDALQEGGVPLETPSHPGNFPRGRGRGDRRGGGRRPPYHKD